MKSNTQNAKIEAITEKTLVLGIDVGSKTHYARAFDYRGIEYSKKPFKFSNTEVGFATFKEWILDLKERHEKDYCRRVLLFFSHGEDLQEPVSFHYLVETFQD